MLNKEFVLRHNPIFPYFCSAIIEPTYFISERVRKRILQYDWFLIRSTGYSVRDVCVENGIDEKGKYQ